MSKLRSVNTKFWEDPWVEGLNPKDKLLFLYLLTNPKTNMLGIFEISISKISFETGLTNEGISKAFEGFRRDKKTYYINNFVILPNFIKNQSMNPNMLKSASKQFENIPEGVKKALSINDSKGFERLSKGIVILRKYESEYESESECDSKKESSPSPLPEKEYYRVIKHLKLTTEDFQKLKSKGYTDKLINDTLDSIENYKKNTNYTSLYLTLKKWIEKDLISKKLFSNEKFPQQLKTSSHEQIEESL